MNMIHTHSRIVATLNDTALKALLTGESSWSQAARSSHAGQYCGLSLDRCPHGMLIGVLPSTEYTREIIVTPLPIRGMMSATVSLTHDGHRWKAVPQILLSTWLTDRTVFATEPTDWLLALSNLVASLRTQKDWRNLDLTPWAIAAAWPDWQDAGLSWSLRAKDLAKRLGTNPLSTNTLTVKCRRLGLVRK